MTMRALYIKQDTDKRLDALVSIKVDSIREANAIPNWLGITSDEVINWLIDTTRKYYKLGDA